VKEFWVYTLMRLGLFVGSFVLIFFAWYLINGDVPVIWVVVLAFVASGLASYFLLERQRQKFAVKVEGRAARMAQRIEEQRAKEDVD
jgi:peptidoglycan/LPS O-acetylase OafA/YrhL